MERFIMGDDNRPIAVLINDDSIQLHTIGDVLESAGFSVVGFSGAEEALGKICEGLRPKVFVSDLHMPGIDGWRLCRLLRAPEYHAFNRTPLFICSATFAGAHAKEVAQDIGANGFFHLPLEMEALRAHLEAVLHGGVPKSFRNVLVVEDTPAQARMIRKVFEDRGDKVHVAETCGKAREMFEELKPEIAIIDYHLPDTNGDLLLPEIKNSGPHTVAIMITTDVDTELASMFIKAGADGYVRKPFDPDYLIALTDKACREQALLRVEDHLERRSKQLRESEERFRSLFENIPECVIVYSRDGVVLHINAVGAEWLADSTETLKGSKLAEILSPDSARAFAEHMNEHIDKGVRHFDLTLVSRKNNEIRCEVKECPFVFKDCPAYMAVFRNVDERRKLEEQLLQVQKMEAIGLLASGVAHDFNNLLTTIMGYSNMLKMESPENSFAYDAAKTIEDASRRATDLTRQLLRFARREKHQEMPVDVHTAIKEVAKFLKRTVEKDIRIVQHLQAEMSSVVGDPSQIHQVILNLAVNARDAMPDGGELVFVTDVVVFDSKTARLYPNTRPGTYLRIFVNDTGCGIPREHLNRIYEPFFTTKESDKGTGMGLAMVYGIVKDHGGFMDVTSSPGQGTRFAVHLPLAKDAAPGEKEKPQAPVRGSGSVMVVDDEESILKMSLAMLNTLGYDVTTAESGEKAIEIYSAMEKKPDVVIIDMNMPDMDGRKCFDELKKIDPEIKAVLSTGYGLDDKAEEFLEAGMVGVVQKPYCMEEISRVVADVVKKG